MRLVIDEQPVNRMQLSAPALRAGVTAVYVQPDGTVVHLGRRLTFGEALSGMYRTMYEVDVARHETQMIVRGNELPTRDDRFSFVANVTVGWQVTQPEVVVREHATDGESLVRTRVLAILRGISRRYQITDCEQVEREISDLNRQGPIPIPEYGLTIDHIGAFVTLDDMARAYLQQQVTIDRQKDLDSRGQELENQRMQGVMAAVQGEIGLIALHLRHHPDEGLQVLQLMHARQQELEQRQAEKFANSDAIFQKMLEAGLVQAADVEEIRKQVLQNTLAVVSGTTTPQAPQMPVNSALPPSLPAPSTSQPPVQPAAPATRTAPGRQAGSSPDPGGVGGWRPRKSPQNGS